MVLLSSQLAEVEQTQLGVIKTKDHKRANQCMYITYLKIIVLVVPSTYYDFFLKKILGCSNSKLISLH